MTSPLDAIRSRLLDSTDLPQVSVVKLIGVGSNVVDPADMDHLRQSFEVKKPVQPRPRSFASVQAYLTEHDHDLGASLALPSSMSIENGATAVDIGACSSSSSSGDSRTAATIPDNACFD